MVKLKRKLHRSGRSLVLTVPHWYCEHFGLKHNDILKIDADLEDPRITIEVELNEKTRRTNPDTTEETGRTNTEETSILRNLFP